MVFTRSVENGTKYLDFENDDDGTGSVSKKIKSQSLPDDSGDSGADTDNEMGPSECKAAPCPLPLSLPPDQTSPLPPPACTPLIALSDVLPMPRRVLTGDFALRLKKEKEVPYPYLHSFHPSIPSLHYIPLFHSSIPSFHSVPPLNSYLCASLLDADRPNAFFSFTLLLFYSFTVSLSSWASGSKGSRRAAVS